VDGVVDAAYANDLAVQGDEPLQRWAGVLVAPRTPQAQGAALIAAAPTNKAALRALLQKIIFTCTAYHAVVQIPLNGFDVSPLTAPCSLYPDAATDAPESMLANLGTSLFQLAFFYFGDVVTYRVGDYRLKKVNIPREMKASVAAFASRVRDITDAIVEANTKRKVGAYESLLPEKVSRSVDI
jgi:hypothetical protein